MRWAAAAALLLLVLAGATRAPALEPGTSVGPERAADVAGLVLPGVVDAVRQGMRMDVVAPERVSWRRAYREATEKHAAQVRLGPRGELLDYVAGLPFPGIDPAEPEAARKIMWNYAFGPWIADDAQAYTFEWETGRLADGRPMRVESGERRDTEQSKYLRMVGRTEVPPIPAFPDNAERIAAMQLFGPTLPVFLTLQRSGPLLSYRYQTLKEDDVWFYTSWDRKARRLPARIRYEAFGDVVIDLNSSFGLDVPLGSYRWRFLGEQTMFGVLHGRHYPARWCEGGGDFAPCEAWEARQVYLVEGVAEQPYDSYGRRVVAIDREAWVILASDLFDRDGKRWKVWMNFWSYRPGGDGQLQPYLLAGSGVDFADRKAIRWRLPGSRPLHDAVQINTGLTPDRFSPAALGSAFAPGG